MSLGQPQLQSPQSWSTVMLAYYSWTWCWAGLVAGPYIVGKEHHRPIDTCNNSSISPKGGKDSSYIQLSRAQKKKLRDLLASGGWLENLSDLRHESLVWRPCWISGGYRSEAASWLIALYIVGIREAQGRNQHVYVWYRNMVERILVGDGGLSWQIRTG